MAVIFRQYLDILLLRTEAFESIRNASDGMAQAIRLFVLVSLFAGLGSCATELRPTPALESASAQFEQMIGVLASVFDLSSQDRGLLTELFELITDIVLRLIDVEPRMGRLPARLLSALGGWWGTPLRWLAFGFNYTLAVLLAAKLLGGTGTLKQHFSLTVLFAAPFTLTVFRFVPYCSLPLLLVAWMWGLAIYIKGISVANEIGIGRAAIAWIAPAIVIVLWRILIAISVIAILFFLSLLGLAAS